MYMYNPSRQQPELLALIWYPVISLQSRFATWSFRHTVEYENVIISRSKSEFRWKIILDVSMFHSVCIRRKLSSNIREYVNFKT